MNISKYAPLFGNSFIELPSELKHPKKGLINIKNKNNKCFLWCHVRHLNPIDNHSNRINKKDKKVANTLDYSSINFPVSKKDYCEIENQNNICINLFSMNMIMGLFIQSMYLVKNLVILWIYY